MVVVVGACEDGQPHVTYWYCLLFPWYDMPPEPSGHVYNPCEKM